MRFSQFTCARTCTILIALFVALVFSSCVQDKSFIRQAYDVTYSSAVTYDTSMTILGDMYKAGQINEEQKAKIIKYAHKYYDTVMVVKKALIAYKKAQLEKDENALKNAEVILMNSLAFVESAEADLLKLLN